VLKVPRTSGDLVVFVDHQKMPAILVFRSLVKTGLRQLITPKRSIGEIDASPEFLHLSHETTMARRVCLNSLEKCRNGALRRGKQHQLLVKGGNGSF
jgi:hypothetical protein